MMADNGLVLQGQVALVTGGGRGIGEAIALAFAGAGADVAVAARTQTQIEAVAEACRGYGRRALAQPLDVTDQDAWPKAVEHVLEQLGRIDILVNNAGGGIFRSVTAMTPDQFDQTIRQNLHSVFCGMHFVAPHMMTRRSGRILNVSSMAAYHAGLDYPAYSAAKAGVNLLTEAMAREFKTVSPQLTCNAICPGPVASRLRSSHFPDEDAGSIMQPPTVAEVALFLASPAAAGINGQAVNVNHY